MSTNVPPSTLIDLEQSMGCNVMIDSFSLRFPSKIPDSIDAILAELSNPLVFSILYSYNQKARTTLELQNIQPILEPSLDEMMKIVKLSIIVPNGVDVELFKRCADGAIKDMARDVFYTETTIPALQSKYRHCRDMLRLIRSFDQMYLIIDGCEYPFYQ